MVLYGNSGKINRQEDKYSLEFSMKYTIPYLLYLFLLVVWLLSRSIAIEEFYFNPEFPDRPWVSEDVHWANQGRFHEKRLNLEGTFLSFRHRRQVIGDFRVPITPNFYAKLSAKLFK